MSRFLSLLSSPPLPFQLRACTCVFVAFEKVPKVYGILWLIAHRSRIIPVFLFLFFFSHLVVVVVITKIWFDCQAQYLGRRYKILACGWLVLTRFCFFNLISSFKRGRKTFAARLWDINDCNLLISVELDFAKILLCFRYRKSQLWSIKRLILCAFSL